MNVVVFGAGSLGSLLGGLLARDHDVTLVGRDPHVSTIKASGLRVSGEFEFTTTPLATTGIPDTADLALVTVKAYDTAEAAEALADCELDSCLSLQNGMGNEAVLADELGCPVLAGTCTYGARLAEPGHVECTGVGEVALGPRGGGTSTVADEVGMVFDDAGIETTVADDMPRLLWEKLAVNAGINATTALADVPNGAVVDGPANDVALAAARETAQVARREGVALSDEAAVAAVEAVATDTAANTSSMRQDRQRGSRTEIDAINGYVVDAAGGEAVPVNRTLTALVRAWERERGLR
jgi:2-dehydropantoate 2-reductase